MKVVTIEVTQQDIDRAHKNVNITEKRSRACSCPVANAAKRIFHNVVTVTAALGISRYKRINGRLEVIGRYMLPQSAKNLIYDFDRLNKSSSTESIKPITFQVCLTKETK